MFQKKNHDKHIKAERLWKYFWTGKKIYILSLHEKLSFAFNILFL